MTALTLSVMTRPDNAVSASDRALAGKMPLPPKVTETTSLGEKAPSCASNCYICPAKVSRGVRSPVGLTGCDASPSTPAVAPS